MATYHPSNASLWRVTVIIYQSRKRFRTHKLALAWADAHCPWRADRDLEHVAVRKERLRERYFLEARFGPVTSRHRRKMVRERQQFRETRLAIQRSS